MAEVLGYLTLQDKALPVGQDGTRIAQWEMRMGLTFEAVLPVRSHRLWHDQCRHGRGKWGFLFYITDEIAFEYPNGGSVTPMTELTDVDNPGAD
jgi:hypothetical protein